MARSMPEGPAERGVEANLSATDAERSAAKSIDGDERGGSIKVVMAGRTRQRRGGFCFRGPLLLVTALLPAVPIVAAGVVVRRRTVA